MSRSLSLLIRLWRLTDVVNECEYNSSLILNGLQVIAKEHASGLLVIDSGSEITQ